MNEFFKFLIIYYFSLICPSLFIIKTALQYPFMSLLKANNIQLLKNIAAETIWPTRCAICDKTGFLLCPKCAANLSFIDSNKSCNVCGEPFGKIQCCGCSPIDKTLTEEEKVNYKPNYRQCLSVVRLDKNSGRIVALCKDAGERRLSAVMAYFMSKTIPRFWIDENTFIAYIPSSKDAVTRRGFDHCELLAKELSAILKIPYIKCFESPKSKDQRNLGRIDRAKNLKGIFSLLKNARNFMNDSNPNIILIDDVYTTGSTLNSAAKVLKNSGANKIYCITFARTF